MSTETITRITKRNVKLDDPILVPADKPAGWVRKRPALEVHTFEERWTSGPDSRGVHVDRYSLNLYGYAIRADGTRGSTGGADRCVTEAAELAALPADLRRALLLLDGEVDQ